MPVVSGGAPWIRMQLLRKGLIVWILTLENLMFLCIIRTAITELGLRFLIPLVLQLEKTEVRREALERGGLWVSAVGGSGSARSEAGPAAGSGAGLWDCGSRGSWADSAP